MPSRRMGLKESYEGCSKVWENDTVALLIGDADNACAALAGSQLAGVDITHIICVANGSTARKLEERHAAYQASGGHPIAAKKFERPSLSRSVTTSSAESARSLEALEALRDNDGVAIKPAPVSDSGDPIEETSEEAAANVRYRAMHVEFKSFRIADKMQPEEGVDISTEWSEHLDGIERAILSAMRINRPLDADMNLIPDLDEESGILQAIKSNAARVAAGAYAGSGSRLPESSDDAESRHEVDHEASQLAAPAISSKRGVLVHCDVGYNRSPTLVMAYLLNRGHSLRDAYRRVLGSRRMVDPLPPFRQALRDYERKLHDENKLGKPSTVQPHEKYAMHISDLCKEVETCHLQRPRQNTDGDGCESGEILAERCESGEEESGEEEGCTDESAILNEAFEIRERSIEALLQESVT